METKPVPNAGKEPKESSWGAHRNIWAQQPQQLQTNAPHPGRDVPWSHRIPPGSRTGTGERPELRTEGGNSGGRARTAAREPPAPAARPGEMLLREPRPDPAPLGATGECPLRPSPARPPHRELTAGFSPNFYFSRSTAQECELPKNGDSDSRWRSPPRRPNTKRSRTPHISSPELF